MRAPVSGDAILPAPKTDSPQIRSVDHASSETSSTFRSPAGLDVCRSAGYVGAGGAEPRPAGVVAVSALVCADRPVILPEAQTGYVTAATSAFSPAVAGGSPGRQSASTS